ncbi:hypothetical protein PbJCM17693_54980 [Paenibacillus macerans]|nr:hypothetical protein PbJCM17693_54980 [Paenibacillus macerans]
MWGGEGFWEVIVGRLTRKTIKIVFCVIIIDTGFRCFSGSFFILEQKIIHS